MQTDVSVCRGGSTSLVEQHLFGIKQIIIPIPRTHDQAGNAQFFAKEYGDIVLDQQKSDREKELLDILHNLKEWKKPALDLASLGKSIQ